MPQEAAAPLRGARAAPALDARRYGKTGQPLLNVTCLGLKGGGTCLLISSAHCAGDLASMRLFVRHWSARYRQLQGGAPGGGGGGDLPEPVFGRLSFDAFAEQGRLESRIWGTFDLGRQLKLLASAIWNVRRVLAVLCAHLRLRCEGFVACICS